MRCTARSTWSPFAANCVIGSATTRLMVNSLHWQGIARLADGLKPEAFAEDGLVEAVRGPDDAAFCLGVQWHPEWAAKSNPVSASLFRRFGAAAKGIAS